MANSLFLFLENRARVAGRLFPSKPKTSFSFHAFYFKGLLTPLSRVPPIPILTFDNRLHFPFTQKTRTGTRKRETRAGPKFKLCAFTLTLLSVTVKSLDLHLGPVQRQLSMSIPPLLRRDLSPVLKLYCESQF